MGSLHLLRTIGSSQMGSPHMGSAICQFQNIVSLSVPSFRYTSGSRSSNAFYPVKVTILVIHPFVPMPTVITYDDDNPLVPILLNEDDHWGVTVHSNALFEPIIRQETGEFSLEFHNLSNSGPRQEDGELNLVVEFHSPQVPSYFWIQHTWFPPADPEHLLGIWFIGSSHVYSRRVKGSDKIRLVRKYSAPLQWHTAGY